MIELLKTEHVDNAVRSAVHRIEALKMVAQNEMLPDDLRIRAVISLNSLGFTATCAIVDEAQEYLEAQYRDNFES